MSQFTAKAIITHTLVLNEWLNSIDQTMAGVNYVYDEGLSVDNALTRLRASRNRDADKTNDDPNDPLAKREFPLLTFKRGVLKHSENGIGRRATIFNPCMPLSQDQILNGERNTVYKVMRGVFPVDFIFYTDSIEESERFEVEYLSEFQAGETKELQVNIPDVGIFSYFMKHGPLSGMEVSLKDMNYKAVTGSIEFEGFFFAVNGDGKAPPILEINLLIKQYNERVLSDILITPQGTTRIE